MLGFFFFFFCNTGDWTWALELARQVLSPLSQALVAECFCVLRSAVFSKWEALQDAVRMLQRESLKDMVAGFTVVQNDGIQLGGKQK
jgi:hypothetical protein